MSGSFDYGLESRFYGLFSQLPWSLVVTAIILLPVIYFVDPSTRALLIEISIYWALVIGVILFIKDIYMQRYLRGFSIKGSGISIHVDEMTTQEYRWEELQVIKKINKKDSLSRKTLEAEGVMLKFKDGFEFPVFERVSDFELFKIILRKVTA